MISCGVGAEVGGDQREVIAAGGRAPGVAQEDDADGVGAPGAVPQAGALGDLHCGGGAVAGDRHGFPGCGAGDVGRSADPVALEPGPATLAGARWGGFVERRVGSGAGGDGHVIAEPGERTGAVGGVGDQADPPIGKPLGDEIHQVTGQVGFGAVTALDRQAGQHPRRSARPPRRRP